MNCQYFESLVNDLARQQMIDVELRADALAHSSACASCATRLADERMLTSGLRALAVETKAFSAPARVETQLLAALRNRQASQRQARSTRWGYFAAAAAAVVLMLAGTLFMLARQRTQEEAPVVKTVPPLEVTVPERPAINDGTVLATNGINKAETNPHQQSASRHRVSAVARDRKYRNIPATRPNESGSFHEGEVASAFVPLGYMSPSSMQDGGQIVRVELPRSAMVNLGFTVNMDRYNERVKADVLVGNDGLARAIRFVQ